MSDTSKATARPWHRHDMEWNVICGPDQISIADFNATSRLKDENVGNRELSLDAVNQYDRLKRIEKLAGELANLTCSSVGFLRMVGGDTWQVLTDKARELKSELEKG